MTTSYNPASPTGHDQPGGGDQEPLVRVAAPQAGLDALLNRREFPLPDLMPPAIVVRRAVGQSKRIVAIVGLTLLGVLALLYLVGRMELASANAQLSASQQALRSAEADKAQYAEVPAVYAAVDAARYELAQAMGNEVQVARLVTQLAAVTPANVSLTQVSMMIGDPEAGSGTTATPSTDQTADLPVGTVTFAGEAASFNDVSAWIDVLRATPDYQNVILTEVSRDSTIGIYTFSNTAELTDQALSGRYVEGAR